MRPTTTARRFAVAPMLDWTDRHCRYFLRQISRHALLYSEMVVSAALIHGKDRGRFLDFDPAEHPIALQLGGSDPGELARCARMAAAHGYDEVNLNVGCPSARVHSGRFGACLMAEPEVVADCVAAMAAAVSIPVTIKHRIGIDERDSYDQLAGFVQTVAEAGCGTFIVHARKAWLKGLSPKQNREIPPLRYDRVLRLKQDFPGLAFVLNGGLRDPVADHRHLALLDGVMLGREAYHNPGCLAVVDQLYFDDPRPAPTPIEVVERMLPYIERELRAGTPLAGITRHMLGLFHGVPGARAWRRHLSENAHQAGATVVVLRDALSRLIDTSQGRC